MEHPLRSLARTLRPHCFVRHRRNSPLEQSWYHGRTRLNQRRLRQCHGHGAHRHPRFGKLNHRCGDKHSPWQKAMRSASRSSTNAPLSCTTDRQTRRDRGAPSRCSPKRPTSDSDGVPKRSSLNQHAFAERWWTPRSPDASSGMAQAFAADVVYRPPELIEVVNVLPGQLESGRWGEDLRATEVDHHARAGQIRIRLHGRPHGVGTRNGPCLPRRNAPLGGSLSAGHLGGISNDQVGSPDSSRTSSSDWSLAMSVPGNSSTKVVTAAQACSAVAPFATSTSTSVDSLYSMLSEM